MIDWGLLSARILGTILSWLHATNLRNQLYAEKEKNEILMTALEDIQRMDDGMVGKHAKRTLELIGRIK